MLEWNRCQCKSANPLERVQQKIQISIYNYDSKENCLIRWKIQYFNFFCFPQRIKRKWKQKRKEKAWARWKNQGNWRGKVPSQDYPPQSR